MRIAVVAAEEQMQEWLLPGESEDADILVVSNLGDVSKADIIIDLLFDINPVEHFAVLEKVNSTLIVVNDVAFAIDNLPDHFIRINGWPTFLAHATIEASTRNENLKDMAKKVFSIFNKQIKWLPVTPGFVTARIIAVIINEAYYANSEGVSSRSDIDLAMKVGASYPYGPFEWSEKIGLKKIYQLLKKLEETDAAYKPCDLLTIEATS